jgi:hypothetical protein
MDFLPDRIEKSRLRERYPAIHELLRQKGVLDGKNELVRFVGIASAGAEQCAMFLPHGAPEHDHDCRKKFAATVMAAISRFARENARTGEAAATESSASFAAVLAAIAEDYRDHGIFSERLRTPSVDTGKPDWRATLRKGVPMLTPDGAPVFTEIRTSRPFSSSENILAIIQAAVVREIAGRHGWWLGESFGKRPLPSPDPLPRWPREHWTTHLRRFRQNLFAERPIVLAGLLEAYLDNEPLADTGRFLCGLSDYSTVWEAMLLRVLPGVEDGWNARLPAPYYVGSAGNSEAGGRMLMDIVIRNGSRIVIADAKYYRATSVGTAPGWPDIVKQIYYAEALGTVAGGPAPSSIDTCFIFPVRDGEEGPLDSVEIRDTAGMPVPRFPAVRCYYAGAHAVAAAYCTGRKISPLFSEAGSMAEDEALQPVT